MNEPPSYLPPSESIHTLEGPIHTVILHCSVSSNLLALLEGDVVSGREEDQSVTTRYIIDEVVSKTSSINTAGSAIPSSRRKRCVHMCVCVCVCVHVCVHVCVEAMLLFSFSVSILIGTLSH